MKSSGKDLLRKLQLGYTFGKHREIVALIFICYFSSLLFLVVAVLVHLTEETLVPVSYRYHALILFFLLILWLVRARLITLARILMLSVPPVVLLLIPSLAGITDDEFFFWFPYVPLGLSLIPHFILHTTRHRIALILVLVIYLMLGLFIDNYLVWSSDGTEKVVPIVRENLFYYNFIPVLLYAFINVALGLLFARNHRYEQIVQRQQEELIQAEKLASLGTLTSGIAHEINNPLNFITGSLQALQALKEELPSGNSSAQEEVFRKMDQVAARAFEGVNRAEDIVSKLGYYAGSSLREREVVHVHELLTRSLARIESKIPYYISLDSDVPEHLKVPCHEKQMLLVFTHILRNAIDALESKSTGQREQITIRAAADRTEDGPFIAVSISNTGPPIPEQNLKRIFDPFFSSAKQVEGTGLGMWLSYMIVKEHGGRMQARNEPGRVTFTVWLPVEM